MRAHVSIHVGNVQKSVDFYEKVFGKKPQKQTAKYAKFDLLNPALNFSMQEAKAGQSVSHVSHFGIEVLSAEEVQNWTERLKALNIETMTEESTSCCYAIQDKVWFQDPDGNHWEVFFVHEQLPTEGAQPPEGSAKGCGPMTGCCSE